LEINGVGIFRSAQLIMDFEERAEEKSKKKMFDSIVLIGYNNINAQ